MFSITSGRIAWPVEIHGQYDDTVCFVTIIFLILYLVVAYSTCPPTAPAVIERLQKATLSRKFKLSADTMHDLAASKSSIQHYFQSTTP